jgi:hypothetical protein
VSKKKQLKKQLRRAQDQRDALKIAVDALFGFIDETFDVGVEANGEEFAISLIGRDECAVEMLGPVLRTAYAAVAFYEDDDQ